MSHFCSIMVIAAVTFAMGCTGVEKERDHSTMSDMAQQATTSKSRSKPKVQTACELLQANEISGFLKVPAVKKDELNSGKNETTNVDLCNWYVKEGGSDGIEVRLRRAESDEGSYSLVFSAAKGDAVEHDVQRDRKAQPLPGVGDEAIYSAYTSGDGGSIALRIGRSAVTITGSASNDALISMAKLVAKRL